MGDRGDCVSDTCDCFCDRGDCVNETCDCFCDRGDCVNSTCDCFCDRGECVNDRCDGGEHHRGRKVTVSCRRVVRKTTETARVTERHDGVGNSGLTK